jgi:hypothetical protein
LKVALGVAYRSTFTHHTGALPWIEPHVPM